MAGSGLTWEERNQRINSNRAQLMTRLGPLLKDDFISLFIQERILLDFQGQELLDIPGTAARCNRFLTLLGAGSDDSFVRFCNLLRAKQQVEIANILLTQGGQSAKQEPAAAAEQPVAAGAAVIAESGASDELESLVCNIRQELKADNARLVAGGGIGGAAANIKFGAHVNAMDILDETEMQKIEAEPTKAGKAKLLLNSLQECSSRNIVLFVWVLIQIQQAHQFKSITKPISVSLGKFKEHADILQMVENSNL